MFQIKKKFASLFSFTSTEQRQFFRPWSMSFILQPQQSLSTKCNLEGDEQQN